MTIKKVAEVVGAVIEYWQLVLIEKRTLEQLTRGFTTKVLLQTSNDKLQVMYEGILGNP
jgi:hypothetical protein